MSDTVAVLGGTGALGRALALRLARAGHPVVLGSRDAARAETSAAELRDLLTAAGSESARIDGATNEDAAVSGEIVLLATPWDESGASISALGDALAGRLVVSCINPLGFDKQGPHGLTVAEGSAAEQVAKLLPASTVAAAFHHLSAPRLANLDKDLSGEDVLVCGDDAGARARVVALAAEVTGRPGVDVGALRQARVLEPFTAVLVAVNKRYKTRAGVLLTHVDVSGTTDPPRRTALTHTDVGSRPE
jgi:NADPH-dependent F420 reductase